MDPEFERIGLSESEQNEIKAEALFGHIDDVGVDEFAEHPDANILDMLPPAERNPIRDKMINDLIERVMAEHRVSRFEAMKMLLGSLIEVHKEEGMTESDDGEKK